MRKNRIFTTTKNTKKFPIFSIRSPPSSKNPWYATVVPCTQNDKSAPLQSASVCRVTLCVYCWVHFATIAKNARYNLFSGRPSKVLPWSWLKSLGLGLGLGTRSLGLGLGLEVQSLGLGLGLDKKVLFTSLVCFCTSRSCFFCIIICILYRKQNSTTMGCDVWRPSP